MIVSKLYVHVTEKNEATKFVLDYSMKFKTRNCPNCDSEMARHIVEDIVKYNPLLLYYLCDRIAGIILKSEPCNFFSVNFSYAIRVPTEKCRYYLLEFQQCYSRYALSMNMKVLKAEIILCLTGAYFPYVDFFSKVWRLGKRAH